MLHILAKNHPQMIVALNVLTAVSNVQISLLVLNVRMAPLIIPVFAMTVVETAIPVKVLLLIVQLAMRITN